MINRTNHNQIITNRLPLTNISLKYINTLLKNYTGTFEAKRLSFALLGLTGLSSRTQEVKDLLGVLATQAATCTGSMTGQEVSMSIRGLVGMDSDDPAVRMLLRSLIPLIRACPSWDSSDMQSALIGLQSMRYSSVEANKLVEAVADLIERSPKGVLFRTAEQASMSLYGIQGMGSVTPEARQLLSKFPHLMSSLRREFSGRDVSQALYGLRSTSCNHKETTELLQTLQPFLENTCGLVTAQNIASAMCCLQNMESSTPEVKILIQSIVKLMSRCSGPLSGKGVSKCLNGLQRLRSKDVVVLELCDALAVILERSEKGYQGFDDFFQISSAISGFTSLDPKEKAVLRLGNAFAKLLQKKRDACSSSMYRQTPSAERVAVAMYALQEISRGAPTPPFANTIMNELLEFMRAMPFPSMKSLGMMMQGFKGVVIPSEPYEQALEILADKLEQQGAWSARLSKDNQGNRKNLVLSETGAGWKEAQTTLRSCLTGLAAMNKQVPARKRLVNLLMRDLKDWPMDVLEKRTLETISGAFFYKGKLLTDFASPTTLVILGDLREALEAHGLGTSYKPYVRLATGPGTCAPPPTAAAEAKIRNVYDETAAVSKVIPPQPPLRYAITSSGLSKGRK